MKKFLTHAIKASLLIATISSVNAQVGINTDTPNDLTVLDVQTQTDNGGNMIPKGVMIPRMTEAQRASIDVSDKDQANSLWIYNTDEDCYNYYSKSDGEWQSLCGAAGRSIFTIDCGATKLNGTYVVENAVNESNYVTVSVNVTKRGTWDITATAKNSNGYSFTGSGLFTETGLQTIRLAAQGTPVSAQTDTLTLNPSVASSAANCTFNVEVQPYIASYALNCSSAVVSGTYVKGTALTAANTISVNVTISSPGSYVISTPVTNGISFQSSGMFTAAGTQMITLAGTGTPTVNTDFPITINTNTTAGAATCSATIPVTLPAMTYATIGSTEVWSWNTSVRLNALQSLTANGLKIAGLTQAWSALTATDGAAHLNSSGAQPDVLLYFSYGTNAYPTAASGIIQALDNYINKGGCVIYAYASSVDPSYDIALLNGIFGAGNFGTVQRQISAGDDNVYPISNFPNDPIINGPFGNLAGRYWGEDNGSTGTEVVTSLPPNSVQICSAATQAANLVSVNPQYSVVWYNDSKNFVFFGDSTGAANYDTGTGDYPAYYTTTGLPMSKRYGNSYSIQYVYNSALELNAVVWALKKAAISGINPH